MVIKFNLQFKSESNHHINQNLPVWQCKRNIHLKSVAMHFKVLQHKKSEIKTGTRVRVLWNLKACAYTNIISPLYKQ